MESAHLSIQSFSAQLINEKSPPAMSSIITVDSRPPAIPCLTYPSWNGCTTNWFTNE